MDQARFLPAINIGVDVENYYIKHEADPSLFLIDRHKAKRQASGIIRKCGLSDALMKKAEQNKNVWSHIFWAQSKDRELGLDLNETQFSNFKLHNNELIATSDQSNLNAKSISKVCY